MPPELSPKQIEALERFRDLEIEFEELRRTLAPLVIYTMEPYRWRVEYKAGMPTIPMTRAHVEAAKAKLASNTLRFWANVVLLTDAYDWDNDIEAITDELHELAFGPEKDPTG
jgi:hypothetical protein